MTQTLNLTVRMIPAVRPIEAVRSPTRPLSPEL